MILVEEEVDKRKKLLFKLYNIISQIKTLLDSVDKVILYSDSIKDVIDVLYQARTLLVNTLKNNEYYSDKRLLLIYKLATRIVKTSIRQLDLIISNTDTIDDTSEEDKEYDNDTIELL